MLSYITNRAIGGNAPSKYLEFLERDRNISADALDEILKTHLIDVDAIRSDNFEDFFEKRKQALYKKIQRAMGQ